VILVTVILHHSPMAEYISEQFCWNATSNSFLQITANYQSVETDNLSRQCRCLWQNHI